MATLLSVEAVEEVLDFWGSATWRLGEVQVQPLALRIGVQGTTTTWRTVRSWGSPGAVSHAVHACGLKQVNFRARMHQRDLHCAAACKLVAAQAG